MSLSRNHRASTGSFSSAVAAEQTTREKPRENNKLRAEDRSIHDWYRFVLSFPPHLVREYVDRFHIRPGDCVLDPFCGTGTTLVECKKSGIVGIGIEPNPMAHFASQTKLDWEVNPDGLWDHAQEIARMTLKKLNIQGISDENDLPLFHSTDRSPPKLKTLPSEAFKILLKNSISPLPLHKTLVLLETMENKKSEKFDKHERLALAKGIVQEIGNLHFGPEVGVGQLKSNAPVVEIWLKNIRAIAEDLRELKDKKRVKTVAHLADARNLTGILKPNSIDAVITSPPYPNEKDYTRTTRLESVLLGFIKSKVDLRALKSNLIRSNTRGVYKIDTDDRLVEDHAEIRRIAEEIEKRRIELGKTSGFERQYARVTKLYFGGMARHFAELRHLLRPGARLAYVVGDQASYLRVMIRTGQLLADIAQSMGYELMGIDLFRTRLATATKEQLREEVVLLRWPGNKKGAAR